MRKQSCTGVGAEAMGVCAGRCRLMRSRDECARLNMVNLQDVCEDNRASYCLGLIIVVSLLLLTMIMLLKIRCLVDVWCRLLSNGSQLDGAGQTD